MKNKISKSILLGLASLSGVSLLVGNVFASYIVSPAPTIGVRIGIKDVKHTITYHLPTSENASTYTTGTIEVSEGASLYDALSDLVGSDVGAYSFTSWHKNKGDAYLKKSGANYASGLIDDETEVDGTITEVYARYAQNNVAYYNDGSAHYLTASNSSLGIDASKLYYGERVYSVTGIDDANVDLGRNSGLYNVTKGTNNWSAKRVINLDVGNLSSWWYTHNNASVKTYIYYFNDTSNGWITNQLSFTNNVATFELDLAYSKFIVVRSSNAASWDNKISQSVNVSLDEKGNRTDGDTKYSSSHTTCYMCDGGYGNDHTFNWW